MRLLLLLLAACTSGIESSLPDGGVVDTHTTTDIVCDKTHASSVTQSSGARTVTTTRFALVSNVTTANEREFCGWTYVQTIPAPGCAGCSETGDQLPTPQTLCFRTHDGTFIGDTLYIPVCGYRVQSYDASGVATVDYSYNYASMRVLR